MNIFALQDGENEMGNAEMSQNQKETAKLSSLEMQLNAN